MADDQLTINDLPMKSIEQILNYVKDRTDRTYSRFVCKLWRDLMDLDSSSECYRIDWSRMIPIQPISGRPQQEELNIFRRLVSWFGSFASQYQNVTYDYEYKANSFQEVIPLFVGFQRKKVSFRFREVDFQCSGSEEFWRQKGPSIVSLEFESKCRNIPLVEINKYCIKLRDLSIDLISSGDDDGLKNLLKNCVSKQSFNSSVSFLHIINVTYTFEDVIIIAKLVDRVFPSIKTVFFEAMTNIDWWNDVSSLSRGFQNFRFTITLSSPRGCNLIIFDPSGQVPEKTKGLSIEANANDSMFNLSLYPKDLSYIERLHLKTDECFELSLIEKILSKCPSLNFLCVEDAKQINSLASAFEEGRSQLEFLEFGWDVTIAIDDTILYSFDNLKSFKCFRMSYNHFTKLLHNSKQLEELYIYSGIIDANPNESIISNGKLIKIEFPLSFLQQPTTKYKFANLIYLGLSFDNSFDHFKSVSRVNDMMKRVFCPKIETLRLGLDQRPNNLIKIEYTQMMVNLLSRFPTLLDLTHNVSEDICPMSDLVLRKILRTHRRLKKIGSYYYPHTFNIISPWNIQHHWLGREYVLFVPK